MMVLAPSNDYRSPKRKLRYRLCLSLLNILGCSIILTSYDNYIVCKINICNSLRKQMLQYNTEESGLYQLKSPMVLRFARLMLPTKVTWVRNII